MGNPLNDRSGVHVHGIDFFPDILFFVSQEMIGVTGSTDIVLREEAVQRLRHSFSHANWIDIDVIGHQDYKVIQIGRHILRHVADQIKEFQHIHI